MLRIFDLIICPAGRALRGFVGTLLRISRDREPYGSSASPLGRVRAAGIASECPILFLALSCLVQFSPAGGETELLRALTAGYAVLVLFLIYSFFFILLSAVG